MPDEKVPGYKKIATRFKNYNKELRDIWENYNILNFYIPKLHNSVKKKKFPPLSFVPLFSQTQKTIKINDTLGAFSSLRLKSSTRSSLIESVITFEDYLSYIISLIPESFL